MKASPKKYKILGAIYSLDVFTIKEVAKFSGVKLNTVHTFFQRYSELFENVEKIKTNRKGGRPTKYKLKNSALKELRRELNELYGPITALRKPKTFKEPFSLNLKIAREIIQNYHLEKQEEKRKEMLDLAERNLKSSIIERSSDKIQRPYFEACLDFEKGKLNFLKAKEIIELTPASSKVDIKETSQLLNRANRYFYTSAKFFIENELIGNFNNVRSFVYSKYTDIFPRHLDLDELPYWFDLLDKVKPSLKNKLFPEIYDDVDSFLKIRDLKLPVRLLDGIVKTPDYLTRLARNSINEIKQKYSFGHMLSIRPVINVSEPDVVLENINKASKKVKNPVIVFLTIDSEDKQTTSRIINKLSSLEHKRLSSVVLDSNFDNSIRAKVCSYGHQYIGKAKMLSVKNRESILKGSIERILNRYNRSVF